MVDMPRIHPTAIVESGAKIADDVEIGPMCYVGPHVTIGAGSKLLPQCHISGHTTLGEKNTVYPFASLGTQAEDFGVEGGCTYLRIGNGNIFREGVTVNTGTKPESATVIGNNCFLMANVHVAHNCILGNNVILVVGAGLSGYVTIFDRAFVSGLTGIHQFCRVGRLAMLSGGSVFSKDIPPFMTAEGRNGGVKMVNLVGLKRAGFSDETIRALRDVHRIFFRSDLNTTNSLVKIRAEVPLLPEVMEFIEFCETSERGVLQNRIAGKRA
jgi:UDP-N-acetylglucosamine acyltransferase